MALKFQKTPKKRQTPKKSVDKFVWNDFTVEFPPIKNFSAILKGKGSTKKFAHILRSPGKP